MFNLDKIIEGLQKPIWVVPVRIIKGNEALVNEIYNLSSPRHYNSNGWKIDGITKVYKIFQPKVTITNK